MASIFNFLFKFQAFLILLLISSQSLNSQSLTYKVLINNDEQNFSRYSRLSFTTAQLRLRAELEKVSKMIDEIDRKILSLKDKGASYSGKLKLDLDKEIQKLDSQRKPLLEEENKKTQAVSDQYTMVQTELARLRNEEFDLKKMIQLGDQYQVYKELDFVEYQIKQYEELSKILYPQKAREEK